MLWGYVALSAAFALTSGAGLAGGDSERVSGGWLVGCYALLSLAEVLLAPLGVSLLTRLAPKEKAGQAVGLWFASCAIGNGLAGGLGLCWERWPHHRYFSLLAMLSLGAAAVLLRRRRQLDGLTALSTSAASQPALDKRMDSMSSTPDLTAHTLSTNPPMTSQAPSPLALVPASLAILLPAPLLLAESPLVRGVSAIACGLAVLLCGSYLLGQAFEYAARRAAAEHG